MPGLDPRRSRPTPLLGNSPIVPASAPASLVAVMVKTHLCSPAAVWADNIALRAFGGSKRLGEGPVTGVAEKLVRAYLPPHGQKVDGKDSRPRAGRVQPGNGIEFCLVRARILYGRVADFLCVVGQLCR